MVKAEMEDMRGGNEVSREEETGAWMRRGKGEERWEYQDGRGVKRKREREVRDDDETGDQSWCVFQSELSVILWKGAVM